MKILESIEIQPSPNLIETLGFSGYSLSSAIADIVDNSIAAKSKRIDIFFDFSMKESSIRIIDDGIGMDKQGLIDCITIAKKSINDERSASDLGRFGLGLKSASVSNAKILTVTSKKADSRILSIRLDIQKIVQSGEWKADFIESDDFIENTGTIIRWDKLTFLNVDQNVMRDHFFFLAEKVEKHLGKVFYEFIKDEKIQIYINNNLIIGKDIFFRKHPKTRSLGLIEETYRGKNIEIEPFILPVYEDLSNEDQIEILGKGLEDQQGFHIFRNNRLIVNGGWLDLEGLRIDNKSNYARIRVSIPNDLDLDFNINFAKNSASVPPMLAKRFIQVAKFARKESSDNYNYKLNPHPKKKITKDTNINVWLLDKKKDKYSLLINKHHPIIEDLTKSMLVKDRNKLFALMSSTIPIREIQQNISYEQKMYDKDIFEKTLLDEFYKMEKMGMQQKEILKKLAQIQPFCDYLWLMNEILLEKGKL